LKEKDIIIEETQVDDGLKDILVKEKHRAAELEETIKLLETKIISITSINAALEDQLDQTLEENRKLIVERMDSGHKSKHKRKKNQQQKVK